jgi:hypothetical protein
MPEDKLQSQRFELKYLVAHDVALAVRDFVSSHLVLDENCIGKPNNSYFNHSLYLDSPDLKLYWDVINSNKNRYKLRLRFYDDNPESPVFFEIKRRSDNAILKQRGPVRRSAVPSILAGQLPESGHLLSNDPKHLLAIQNFCRLMMDIRAAPKTRVTYLREAWVSTANNAIRVTLDRDVCSVPHLTSEITTKIENPTMPWRSSVILELKFTDRFPTWFGELVRVFGVMQCGVAKYAEGVAILGERRFNLDFHSHESKDLVEKFLNRRRRCGTELQTTG